MPKGIKLTTKERGAIKALHREGYALSAIAKRVKRSRDVVRRFIQSPGTYRERTPSNGNKKLTETAHRLLIREASKGTLSATQLVRSLNLQISPRRVQQILSASPNLCWTRMKKAPLLTREHKMKRLEWARNHHAWTPAQWGTVVFSDEKRFNLDGPDGIHAYWHDLRKDKITLSRRQNGGGGIMVRGSFSERGVSKLAILEGKQDSRKYTDTLQSFLLPVAASTYSNRWIFQQDNAAIHTSMHTKGWFLANNFNVMKWPARSPDLNPIENIWGVLARRVYNNGRQFETVTHLKAIVEEAWSKLDRVLLYKLVRSMRNRCVEVLEKQGAKTNY